MDSKIEKEFDKVNFRLFDSEDEQNKVNLLVNNKEKLNAQQNNEINEINNIIEEENKEREKYSRNIFKLTEELTKYTNNFEIFDKINSTITKTLQKINEEVPLIHAVLNNTINIINNFNITNTQKNLNNQIIKINNNKDKKLDLKMTEQEYLITSYRSNDNHLLMVINTEASEYLLWQTRSAAKALREAGYKNILQIINAPYHLKDNIYFNDYKNETTLYIKDVFEDILLPDNMKEKFAFDEIPTLLCPSYAKNEPTGDYYAARNRIGSFIEFYKYIDNLKERNIKNPYENITTIGVIDPDMIVNYKLMIEPTRFHPFNNAAKYIYMEDKIKMIKKYSNVDPNVVQNIDPTPMFIHIDDLRSILPDWMNITNGLRQETDEEIISPKEWICEMYGYILASAIQNLTHHSSISNFAVPLTKNSPDYANEPLMYHYNYKIDLHTNYTFFKHNYMTKPPYPRPLPSPPSSAKNTVKKVLKILSDHLTYLLGTDDTPNPMLIPGLD